MSYTEANYENSVIQLIEHPECKIATMPSSNVDFWQEKFRKNVERDAEHTAELKRLGWNLIVVWGYETTKKTFPPAALLDFVNSNPRCGKRENDFAQNIEHNLLLRKSY